MPAQGDAAQKHSGCSRPARSSPWLCLRSCCFSQRHMEGESWLESMWAGEMGVWVGHVGLICRAVRWGGGTWAGERYWDGAEVGSTDCMAWEHRQLWLSQEGRGASRLLCRGHAGQQQWCLTGSLWGRMVPGKWHCAAYLGTHNLPLIHYCSMEQRCCTTHQGGCRAHPGRAGLGPDRRGHALQAWTDTVCVSACGLLVLLAQSHLPGW